MSPAYLPINRGFDEHEGYFQGCKSQSTHVASCCSAPSKNASDFSNFICDAPSSGPDYRGADWFRGTTFAGGAANNNTPSSLLIASLAEDAIARFATDPTTPFFIYLPFQNIHAPYDAAWENVQLFANLGYSIEQMTMFAYIKEMDDAIGRIIAALKNAGIEANDTVIIAASDNGAPNAPNVMDRNWPLSGFKSGTHEGGTRVPAIIYAPAYFPPNLTVDAMVHAVDWMPTLASIWGGGVGDTIDGIDQGATFAGGAPSRLELVINVNHVSDSSNTQFSYPSAAIRVGDMKLLCWQFTAKGVAGATTTGCHDDPAHPGDWPQVYNVSIGGDVGEEVNLAPSNPQLVQTLLARMIQLAGPGETAEPMVWTPPYQGADYYCANCPLRNKTGPFVPWGPWLSDPSNF